MNLRRTLQCLCAWSFLLALAGAFGQAAAGNEAVADGEIRSGHVEVSYGHEKHSSPLIRLSDNSGLIRIEGRKHLSGTIRQISASGTLGTTLSSGTSLQVGGTLYDKTSDNAPDLDFRLLAIDPLISIPLFSGSLAFGPSLQHIEVAGQPFRKRQSLHLDWSVATDDGGYLSYVLEHGRNRHAADFVDFDSVSSIALIRRQFIDPLPWLKEFSIEGGYSRESNRQGLAYLSSKLIYTRLGAGWDIGDFKVDLGWMHQSSRFDSAELAEFPARRDHFDLGEFSLAYTVNQWASVRLDLSHGLNKANSELFQSRFKSAMINLQSSF